MSGQHVFITGGAGFIGVNAADHFLRRGDAVTVYDNLSRRGGPVSYTHLEIGVNIGEEKGGHGSYQLVVGSCQYAVDSKQYTVFSIQTVYCILITAY